MESEPRSLLLWQQGCDREPMRASLNAAVAAFEAAAFRLATLQEQAEAASPRWRASISRQRGLPDLDLTLASAAGNNIARWLTALPPNTLDAAGYRRILQISRGIWHLDYRFYGESAAASASARALSWRSPRAMRRAMPGSCACPTGRAAPPRRHVSLVGKGICFDTGGTNLKPHKSMLDMHTDMEGSAVARRQPVRAACAALAARGGLLAGHHGESHRPARLQTARCGARPQRHDHSGDPHRRRRPHGARRHA